MTFFVESVIEITQGPQNVTVNEGESASFPCFYHGTDDVPVWFINSASYNIQRLPTRHTYYNETLRVTNVQASDNGATYKCAFLYDQMEISSTSTGTLTVLITATQGTYG